MNEDRRRKVLTRGKITTTREMAEAADIALMRATEKDDPVVKSSSKYKRGQNVDFKVC